MATTTIEAPASADVAALTPREIQVAARLAAGLTVREIGGELEISPKTVDVHKTRAMKKTRISRRATLTLWSLRIGLIDADGTLSELGDTGRPGRPGAEVE